MTRLIDDLANLSDVSENILRKFVPLINYSVAHAVHEADCEQCDDTVAEIDLEIGELQIRICSDTVKYRFIPSKELDSMICSTVRSGVSPLVTKLNNNLQEKIDKSYKELL